MKHKRRKRQEKGGSNATTNNSEANFNNSESTLDTTTATVTPEEHCERKEDFAATAAAVNLHLKSTQNTTDGNSKVLRPRRKVSHTHSFILNFKLKCENLKLFRIPPVLIRWSPYVELSA